MPTLSEKIKAAAKILHAGGIVDPGREAKSLIAAALKRDATFLIAHPEHELDVNDERVVDEFVTRRAAHEPFQYISGIQEFYGLDFEVSPDVLIPRPETEMIVEHALEILKTSRGESVCDVGTGSGCILISILHELTLVRAWGLDISQNALNLARRNAEKHNVSDRLELLESDLFDALDEKKFDLIVSNPPYVPARDIAGLQAEVRDFEPHIALTDQADGLSIIRRIVNETPHFLADDGHLLMEIGFNQSTEVVEMFDVDLWFWPKLFPDLQGIPRLVSAQLR